MRLRVEVNSRTFSTSYRFRTPSAFISTYFGVRVSKMYPNLWAPSTRARSSGLAACIDDQCNVRVLRRRTLELSIMTMDDIAGGLKKG